VQIGTDNTLNANVGEPTADRFGIGADDNGSIVESIDGKIAYAGVFKLACRSLTLTPCSR
jgi:hypothetical protein